MSKGSLQGLVEQVLKFDFAVLIMTPDDLTEKRGVSEMSPRDNVIFELGLFMGALGPARTSNCASWNTGAASVSVHRDPRIVGEDRGAAEGAIHRSPARVGPGPAWRERKRRRK